jgi:aminoglycoside phosphotransferase (APT) family kinase protein
MPTNVQVRAEQVRALLRDALGEEARAVTHQDFGHQSLTFDVTLPSRSVIVRTNDDARAFAATERNLVTLAGLGLPVPRVLAADLTAECPPFGWMILEKIPGRDLRDELGMMTEAQMTRLAEQIVGFQKRVMGLPAGAGFGYAPLGGAGPFVSLWDLLHEGEAATAGVMEPRLAALVGAREDYFRQTPPTCFLDDLTIKNVIVQGGELQGLVDFDFVCYGDPLFWLGLTATVLVCDLGQRERFYGDELCRLMELTAEGRSVVALYAAWISLGFVQKFGTGQSEAWRARMGAAREEWLAEAEGKQDRGPRTSE